MDVVHLAFPFGKVTKFVVTRRRRQALIEFSEHEAAVAMQRFHAAEPLMLHGSQVDVQVSDRYQAIVLKNTGTLEKVVQKEMKRTEDPKTSTELPAQVPADGTAPPAEFGRPGDPHRTPSSPAPTRLTSTLIRARTEGDSEERGIAKRAKREVEEEEEKGAELDKEPRKKTSVSDAEEAFPLDMDEMVTVDEVTEDDCHSTKGAASTAESPDAEGPMGTAVSHGVAASEEPVSHGVAAAVESVSHGGAATVESVSHGVVSSEEPVSHGVAATETLMSHGVAATEKSVSHGGAATVESVSHGGAASETPVSHGGAAAETPVSHGVAALVKSLSHGGALSETPVSHGGAASETPSADGQQPMGGEVKGAAPVAEVATSSRGVEVTTETQRQAGDSLERADPEDEPPSKKAKILQTAGASQPSMGEPIGMEFLVPKTGFYCQLCCLFYSRVDVAKKVHCSSSLHYRNVEKYRAQLKRKQQQQQEGAPP